MLYYVYTTKITLFQKTIKEGEHIEKY